MTLLSELALELQSLNSAAAYRRLVVSGDGHLPAKNLLSKLRADDLFAKAVKRTDEAHAALAALWLWHDWLEDSHTICQHLDTPTGSYWHAILHRREGDFSNSKYWYARAADHPVMKAMAPSAAEIIKASPVGTDLQTVLANGWSPTGFVDLISDVHNKSGDPRETTLVALQCAEWEALFELTIHAAVSGSEVELKS